MVEDNEADVSLIREAIQATQLNVIVSVVNDGKQAIEFFDRADGHESLNRPTLVILDINLPKKQGSEVLKHMRASRRSAQTFVIVVSTSDSQRDRDQMIRLGANGYFCKPSNYGDFMKLADLIKSALLQRSES